VAAEASRLARKRGWEQILVSGGEQHTDSLVAALPPAMRATALRDHRVLVRLDLATVEAIVTERVRAAHAELENVLIGKVREQAHGAGAAALGLSEVVGALNQARVAHLVYDPFVRYRGSVAEDGTLYADDEIALRAASTADLRLTERIVERALATGARVTPVEGAAADGLAEADGIAAVLGWESGATNWHAAANIGGARSRRHRRTTHEHHASTKCPRAEQAPCGAETTLSRGREMR